MDTGGRCGSAGDSEGIEMTKNEARQILIDYNAWRKSLTIVSMDEGKEGKTTSAIDAAIVALSAKNKSAVNTLEVMRYEYCGGEYWKPPIGKPVERSKSSIAQAIRDAAVNWPQFVGVVESRIIDSFCNIFENFNVYWRFDGQVMKADSVDGRTFMLLVAEALES